MQSSNTPQPVREKEIMNMKKIFALTLAVLMTLSLFAGCKPTADNNAANEYDLVNPGKLTVAISPDFSPMEFVDPTKTGQDQFVGFDVSLSKFIAQELGVTLEIKPMDFDACQAAVDTGKVDMSISGYSWTEKREKNYNLSDYYYAGENETEQVLITLKENAGKYTTADALKGVKVGAQGASLPEELVKAQLPDSELVLFTDLGTAVLQLKSGDFDCVAVADGNGDAIIAKNPEIAKSGFVFYVDPKETGNVIMLHKGADDLTNIVNQILADSEQYWESWYAYASSISGIDQSYDEQGNAITN